MAFQNFPYSNLHELNTDAWLRKQKELNDAQKNLENRQDKLEVKMNEVDETIATMVPPVMEQWVNENFNNFMVNATYRQKDQTLVLAPTSDPPAGSKGNIIKNVQLFDQLLGLTGGGANMYQYFADMAAAETGTICVTAQYDAEDTAKVGGGIYAIYDTPPEWAGIRAVALGGRVAVLVSPGPIHTRQLGITDQTPNVHQRFTALFNSGEPSIVVDAGTYNIIGPITAASNDIDIQFDNVIFNSAVGVSNNVFTIGKDYLENRQLMASGMAFEYGTRNIATGFNAGEIAVVCSSEVYNPARDYYTKGEMLAMSGDGDTALSGCIDKYTGASVYKLPGLKINITGSLTINNNAAYDTFIMACNCLVNSRIEGVTINDTYEETSGYENRHLLSLRECYNVIVEKCYSCRKNMNSGSNVYAFSVLCSQTIRFVNVVGYAPWHAFSAGAEGGAGNSIVNRFLDINGSFDSSVAHSADCHGNSEHVKFTGNMMNGVCASGDYVEITGNIETKSSFRAQAIYISENVGMNFNIHDCRIYHGAEDMQMMRLNKDVVNGGGCFRFRNNWCFYRGTTLTSYPALIELWSSDAACTHDLSGCMFANFQGNYVIETRTSSGRWRILNLIGCETNLSKFVDDQSSIRGYIPNIVS